MLMYYLNNLYDNLYKRIYMIIYIKGFIL